MDNALPRLRSITGVARALISTVGVDDAVSILVTQFGWDVAFLALAHLEDHPGEVPAGRALWLALEALPLA
jgi:hypothetical protein